MLYHDLYQLLECCLGRIPAKLGLCLGWISQQVDNVRRAVELIGYINDYLSG